MVERNEGNNRELSSHEMIRRAMFHVDIQTGKQIPQYPEYRKVTKAQALGFHRDAQVPVVPDGMELVKFHGEPAVIPGAHPEEEKYGNSTFTKTQIEVLQKLEQERLAKTADIFVASDGVYSL